MYLLSELKTQLHYLQKPKGPLAVRVKKGSARLTTGRPSVINKKEKLEGKIEELEKKGVKPAPYLKLQQKWLPGHGDYEWTPFKIPSDKLQAEQHIQKFLRFQYRVNELSTFVEKEGLQQQIEQSNSIPLEIDPETVEALNRFKQLEQVASEEHTEAGETLKQDDIAINYDQISERRLTSQNALDVRYKENRLLFEEAVAVAREQYVTLGSTKMHHEMTVWLQEEYTVGNGQLPYVGLNKNGLMRKIKELLYELGKSELVKGSKKN